MHILVTGAAGFIGFFLCRALLEQGRRVFGLDNLNAYYAPELKKARLKQLKQYKNFRFQRLDMAGDAPLHRLFATEGFTHVVNLAAQAGVRYSLSNPQSYVQSNLLGFGNLLEACRQYPVEHLVYASSSSVYGLNSHIPFNVSTPADHPASLYAASKKANELMAHAYSHLYHIPCTGLRFFTVYGPWGRPDMAYFSFTRDILAGKPIKLFNQGRLQRDFTYIDDIINGVMACLFRPAAPDPDWMAGGTPDPASSSAPYKIYNLGNSRSIPLLDFVNTLEELLRTKAIIEYLPMQPGDVHATFADIERSAADLGFAPTTDLKTGLTRFIDWYKTYYGQDEK
ncbi:MAG: NAD-dependent epimerase [Deltaproteobacteria bacterium]|jgi:UDP-glucuronate 4-epimerase|nr:NAD-dependent epimerase [Deltaproteobacteria bacterium]